MLCLSDDDNRIVLRPIEGHVNCQRDFINACCVDVCMLSYTHLTIYTPSLAYYKIIPNFRVIRLQENLLPLKVSRYSKSQLSLIINTI